MPTINQAALIAVAMLDTFDHDSEDKAADERVRRYVDAEYMLGSPVSAKLPGRPPERSSRKDRRAVASRARRAS